MTAFTIYTQEALDGILKHIIVSLITCENLGDVAEVAIRLMKAVGVDPELWEGYFQHSPLELWTALGKPEYAEDES